MPGFFDDFVCPHCSKLTSFEAEDAVEADSYQRRIGPNAYTNDVITARRYRCQNPKCRRSVLVMEKNGSGFLLAYPFVPGSRTLDSTVPSSVGDAYAEASQCQAIGAMRAAGAMYRMALELICDEQGVPRAGNNAEGKAYARLVNRVPDLEAKGLPHDLVQNMHEVRLVGNDSIHEGIAFSTDELDDVGSMIEEAAQVLWVQPAQREAMRAAREARRAGSSALPVTTA